jgi:kinesin family protein 5
LEPSKDNLKIRELPGRGIFVEDITENYVASYDEVLDVMAAGQTNRAIGSTKMNFESSRSHSVFILTLGQLNKLNGTRKGSKLTLVDLAGSEKVQKTGAVGVTLKEAQHINKSLSALGNVINSLTTNQKHVPYRDSKLTRLLSDSLGGNSKTVLVITCSPMSSNAEETLSTLRFGSRAKNIKNKPKVNQEKSVAEYKRLLALEYKRRKMQEATIRALVEDLDALQAYIAALPPEILKLKQPPVLRSTAARESLAQLPQGDSDPQDQ